jgi:hypothetical protein
LSLPWINILGVLIDGKLYYINPHDPFIFFLQFDSNTLFTFVHFTIRITIYAIAKVLMCYSPRLTKCTLYALNAMQLV